MDGSKPNLYLVKLFRCQATFHFPLYFLDGYELSTTPIISEFAFYVIIKYTSLHIASMLTQSLFVSLKVHAVRLERSEALRHYWSTELGNMKVFSITSLLSISRSSSDRIWKGFFVCQAHTWAGFVSNASFYERTLESSEWSRWKVSLPKLDSAGFKPTSFPTIFSEGGTKDSSRSSFV